MQGNSRWSCTRRPPVLSSSIAHLNKPNVDIYEYREVYLDDWTDPENEETKPLIPDKMVIMISSAANFMLGYGACTYIEDASGQWVTAQTDRVLRSYVEHISGSFLYQR